MTDLVAILFAALWGVGFGLMTAAAVLASGTSKGLAVFIIGSATVVAGIVGFAVVT